MEPVILVIPADIKEYPNYYEIIMDLPGLKNEDIKVQVAGMSLTIRGERKREEEEDFKYLKMDRIVGKFMNEFPLNDNCNREAISASNRNGVLRVNVPKLPPTDPNRTITIAVTAA